MKPDGTLFTEQEMRDILSRHKELIGIIEAARKAETQNNPEIKWLVELPMTDAQHTSFQAILRS